MAAGVGTVGGRADRRRRGPRWTRRRRERLGERAVRRRQRCSTRSRRCAGRSPSPPFAAESKQQLGDAVFGGQIGRAAQDVRRATPSASAGRRPRDLADALEEVAIIATAASAEQPGKLDEVEDELFRFGRIVDANPELREALSDRAATRRGASARWSTTLLGRKVGKATKRLCSRRSWPAGTARRREASRDFQSVLAARRERLLATAWVAHRPQTPQQRARMTTALIGQLRPRGPPQRRRGPDVIGGVRVMVGDEVIDGSVETRLAEAQRQLIG